MTAATPTTGCHRDRLLAGRRFARRRLATGVADLDARVQYSQFRNHGCDWNEPCTHRTLDAEPGAAVARKLFDAMSAKFGFVTTRLLVEPPLTCANGWPTEFHTRLLPSANGASA